MVTFVCDVSRLSPHPAAGSFRLFLGSECGHQLQDYQGSSVMNARFCNVHLGSLERAALGGHISRSVQCDANLAEGVLHAVYLDSAVVNSHANILEP